MNTGAKLQHQNNDNLLISILSKANKFISNTENLEYFCFNIDMTLNNWQLDTWNNNSLNQARVPMKTIVRILNYYLNPIFNNALDVCVQLTRVSWWVFGNFITISIETKCRAEGQDVTTITSRCHHLSDFFIWKLKFKASSGTIGNPFNVFHVWPASH